MWFLTTVKAVFSAPVWTFKHPGFLSRASRENFHCFWGHFWPFFGSFFDHFWGQFFEWFLNHFLITFWSFFDDFWSFFWLFFKILWCREPFIQLFSCGDGQFWIIFCLFMMFFRSIIGRFSCFLTFFIESLRFFKFFWNFFKIFWNFLKFFVASDFRSIFWSNFDQFFGIGLGGSFLINFWVKFFDEKSIFENRNLRENAPKIGSDPR